MKGVTLEENRKHLAVRVPCICPFACCSVGSLGLHLSCTAFGNALAREHAAPRSNTCGLCSRPLASNTLTLTHSFSANPALPQGQSTLVPC